MFLRRLRVRDGQKAICHRRSYVLQFRTNRYSQVPGELPAAAFLDCITALLLLLGDLDLAGDNESIAMELNGDIRLLHAGQLEGCSNEIVFLRFMDVNPNQRSVPLLS